MRFKLVLFLLSVSNFLFSQNKSSFWDQVQFGGGINLNVSNSYTVIGLAPSAIYNFSDSFGSGISGSYLYIKNANVVDALNVYGGSIFSIYKPFDGVQFIGEFEENFINQGGVSSSIPALYVGAGYSLNQNIGIGLRYDLLYEKANSIYPSAFTPYVKIFF